MSAQELERTGSMHFLQVFTAGLGGASERHANMWQQHQAPADDVMGGAAVTSAEPGRLDPGLCSAVAVAARSAAAAGTSHPQQFHSHVVIADRTAFDLAVAARLSSHLG
jgi:hypothetical protein